MHEVRGNEVNETKMPESEGYKEIKSDDTKTDTERMAFLEDKFQNIENTKELDEIGKDYIEDLKEKSEVPETIRESSLDTTKLERQVPEKVAELREEFDDSKSKLRKEWEELNGKEWPKYTEDIVNEKGQVLRRMGDNYDAHHIQPLCLGGKNEASNLTPLDLNSHKAVHTIEGSCTTLVNKVGGNS